MSKIRVYHSFRSPYSRLGLHKVSRAGLDVELIAFTGPPEGTPFAMAKSAKYWGHDRFDLLIEDVT